MNRLPFLLVSALVVGGCGGSGSTDDAGPDTGRVDAAVAMDAAAIDAPPHCTTDDDGDGHRSRPCGGDDCDDADANAYPGNAEVCDATNHDEDCDPRTYGSRDNDHDTYVDDQCCNADVAGGGMFCGTDCNDMSPVVHPTAPEVCNGMDDDCNGNIDEGVLVAFYADCDHDGWASPGATSSMTCSAPTTRPTSCDAASDWSWTAVIGDCDDAQASVHMGGTEVCDGLDDDCDGIVDPGCSCATGATRACGSMVGTCTVGTQTCGATGTWGTVCPGSVSATPELCDTLDNDCDGVVDNGVTVGCYADHDHDAFAATGAALMTVCPDSVGHCPSGFTSVSPGSTLTTDCDDAQLTVHPGAPDICDLLDNDCNGLVDDGGGAAYYADCDVDNYGQTSVSVLGCSVPASPPSCSGGRTGVWRVTPGDCNDTNATIHPGAAEVCDGVDQDCNATLDDEPAADAACTALGLPHTTSAVCASAMCGPSVCATGYANCSAAPGCETDTANDPANCGSCGHACFHPSCSAGVCVADYAEVAVGASFACARRWSGSVDCWGDNTYGELGIGSTDPMRTTPTPVMGLTDATSIVIAGNLACATRRTGGVSCWGGNCTSACGFPAPRIPAPVDIGGFTDARAVAIASIANSYVTVLVAHGSMGVTEGYIVDGSPTGWAPTDLPAVDAREVALIYGSYDTPIPCVRDAAGAARCINGFVWVAVAGLPDALSIAAGGASPPPAALGWVSLNAGIGYAVRRDGSVGRWYVQYGAGTTRVSASTTLAAPTDALSMGRGSDFPDAPGPWVVRAAGALTEVSVYGTYPGPAGLGAVRAAASWGATNCVVLQTGQAMCWGDANTYGQLGDGTTDPHTDPAPVIDS